MRGVAIDPARDAPYARAVDRIRGSLLALLLIAVLSLLSRLPCAIEIGESNLTPDGARFLNLAFALLLTLAFLAAAPRGNPPNASASQAAVETALAGAFFGLAFLVRAQAVLAIPALLALLVVSRRSRARASAVAFAAFGALIVI